MPKISGFGRAPRDDPLSYPGKRPESAFLFCGDHIRMMRMRPGDRLEQSIVESDGKASRLEDLCNVQDMYMVVGYGSNPNPAQLESKFAGEAATIPLVKGTLPDCDVVYAPFFSSYGAVPATLCRSEGTVVEMWASLLDERQLEIMDVSENRGRNYRLARMDCEMVLESGERFSPVYAYVCIAGTLCLGGKPLRLDAVQASNTAYPGATEREAIRKAGRALGLEKAYPTVESLMAEVKKRRNSYNVRLKAEYSCEDGLIFEELDLGTRPKRIGLMERSF